jgi:Ricin-type beta-trefoil lectin domain-like
MFIRRRIFQVMAALIVLLGFAFGPASATPAAAATTYYHTIYAAHSGHNLDVEGASTADGARIIQWYQSFSGNSYAPNQLWTFEAVPNTYDTYYIKSRSSGKVLTVNSYAAGAQVVQWTTHGGTNQQWVEVKVGAASKYRNVWSGLYLDVSGYSYAAGAPLVQWYQTSGLNQQFYIY